MEKHLKQSKVSFRRVLFVSLLVIGISIFSSMSVNATTDSDNSPSYSLLTPHDPISICSDYGFKIFPGSGTEEDPYLIEGLEIITTDSSGIYITDTTKYFIVRNCYVDADWYGIYITEVANGTATVINNTCNNNNEFGIGFRDSGGSTVANNTFTNCGLYIREDNIEGYHSYTVENNLVNGKKLGYYTNLDSTIIDEPVYGQIILVNCNNVTVRDQILDSAGIGLSIYSCSYSTFINNTCNNNYYYGIHLYYSDSSTVSNNMCNNNHYGIFLLFSGNSTVTNNMCNNNNDYGIFLLFSGNSTVINNMCNNNNDYGIFLSDSGNSTVANNTCSKNNFGIWVFYSGSSNVESNTCSNNIWFGIYLDFSGSSKVESNTCGNNNNYGISIDTSSSSIVINNTCSNNNYGIYLESSDFCVVIYNLLQENEKYGVYLTLEEGIFVSSSDNNLIHHNTFVDNNIMRTSQAFDGGTNNTWYDSETLEGNYWSDWLGTGSYAIDVSAISLDPYPLDEPAEYSTDETKIHFTFTLLIVVVPLLLTKLFSRKRRKMIKR